MTGAGRLASGATLRLSRQLQLLRAHSLIFKIAKTHYYRITKKRYEVFSEVNHPSSESAIRWNPRFNSR